MWARLREISLILNKPKEQILHPGGHQHAKNNVLEPKLKLLQYLSAARRPIRTNNSNRDHARYVHDHIINEKLELDQ